MLILRCCHAVLCRDMPDPDARSLHLRVYAAAIRAPRIMPAAILSRLRPRYFAAPRGATLDFRYRRAATAPAARLLPRRQRYAPLMLPLPPI